MASSLHINNHSNHRNNHCENSQFKNNLRKINSKAAKVSLRMDVSKNTTGLKLSEDFTNVQYLSDTTTGQQRSSNNCPPLPTSRFVYKHGVRFVTLNWCQSDKDLSDGGTRRYICPKITFEKN